MADIGVERAFGGCYRPAVEGGPVDRGLARADWSKTRSDGRVGLRRAVRLYIPSGVCRLSSVGRATACGAVGRRFEPYRRYQPPEVGMYKDVENFPLSA